MIGLVSLCAIRSATFFLFIWVYQSCDVGLWHLQSRISAAGLRGWLSSKPLSYQSHTTRTKELWEPGKQAHWAICSDTYGLCLLKLWRWAPCQPTSKVTAAGLKSNNAAESLQVFSCQPRTGTQCKVLEKMFKAAVWGWPSTDWWLYCSWHEKWVQQNERLSWDTLQIVGATYLWPCGVVRWCAAETGDLSHGTWLDSDLRCKFEDLSLAWLTLIRVNLTLICSLWCETWLFEIKYLTNSDQQINTRRGTCLRLEG